MKSIAIAAALLVLTAGAAHAFTYERQSGGGLNLDGTPRFADPEDALTDGAKSTKSKSGFSMHFGTSSTPGFGAFALQNRFQPGANRAFNAPFQPQTAPTSPFFPNN